MEPLLTVKECADLLRVTERTVRRWCRDGIIPRAIHPGRAWRIPREALEALATMTRAGSPPDLLNDEQMREVVTDLVSRSRADRQEPEPGEPEPAGEGPFDIVADLTARGFIKPKDGDPAR